MSIQSHMITFLSDVSLNTFDKAKQALVSMRNIVFPGYSNSQSRSLWYSLLLYKWKSEHSCNEELWKIAREFILMTLRNQESKEISDTYLRLFTEWKTKDLQSFVVEMATFYVQLIDIKDAIERTGNPSTIIEWKDSYQSLLQKVRDSAVKLKCVDQLDNAIIEIKRAREQYVYDMLHCVYWDTMEEELERGETTILLCHLSELRDICTSIFPSEHPILDITDTIQHIQQNTFTNQEAWKLFCNCIILLKTWDSSSNEHVYDEILCSFSENKIESWSKWVRILMEKSTILAMDLKTRKALWKIVLSTEQK